MNSISLEQVREVGGAIAVDACGGAVAAIGGVLIATSPAGVLVAGIAGVTSGYVCGESIDTSTTTSVVDASLSPNWMITALYSQY